MRRLRVEEERDEIWSMSSTNLTLGLSGKDSNSMLRLTLRLLSMSWNFRREERKRRERRGVEKERRGAGEYVLGLVKPNRNRGEEVGRNGNGKCKDKGRLWLFTHFI